MKFVLPILVFSALAVVLIVHQQRSKNDKKWQEIQSAMQQVRTSVKQGTVIGCPVDSNHTRAFYECRYWLAPVVVLSGNANERDTQLILLANDERSIRPLSVFPDTDTLLNISNPSLHAILIKRKK